MREITFFHIERMNLSSEITVMWFWEDFTPRNPYYLKGTDPNDPHTGVYRNGKLVSTVNWNQSTVTLEMVERFLRTNSQYQLRPGWSPVPETI